MPDPDPQILTAALAALDAGKLVVYPTETVYGLGADALNESAVEEVFDAKARPGRVPITVAVATVEEMGQLVRMNDLAFSLARRFLPGPLTIVLPARPGVPEVLLGGTETLGVRIPAHPTALALCRGFGPITATSANVHGAPDSRTVSDAKAQLGARVAVYVDGGFVQGLPSTVVDASGAQAKVIRSGAVSEADLHGR